jgi:hypothetical protein
VVITRDGKPAGVLDSRTEYDRMTEKQRFLESVALGVADPRPVVSWAQESFCKDSKTGGRPGD